MFVFRIHPEMRPSVIPIYENHRHWIGIRTLLQCGLRDPLESITVKGLTFTKVVVGHPDYFTTDPEFKSFLDVVEEYQQARRYFAMYLRNREAPVDDIPPCLDMAMWIGMSKEYQKGSRDDRGPRHFSSFMQTQDGDWYSVWVSKGQIHVEAVTETCLIRECRPIPLRQLIATAETQAKQRLSNLSTLHERIHVDFPDDEYVSSYLREVGLVP